MSRHTREERQATGLAVLGRGALVLVATCFLSTLTADAAKADPTVCPADTLGSADAADSADVCLSTSATWTNLRLGERAFLSLEGLTSPTLQDGVLRPDVGMTGAGAALQLSARVPAHGGFSHGALSLNLATGRAEGRLFRDTYDATTDPGLILWFPGVYPVGIGPYPMVRIDNLTYTAEVRWRGAELNYDLQRSYAQGGFGLRLGALHQRTDLTERLTGDLPFYLSSVAIGHDIATTATGVHLGVHHDFVLPGLSGGWEPRLRLRWQVGAARVTVRGTVEQSFGGLIGGSIPAPVPVSATLPSSVQPYGSIGASLTLASPRRNLRWHLDIDHAVQPWGARVAYALNELPRLERQSMRATTVALGMTLRF